MSRLPAPCHLITSQQAPSLPPMLSQHPSNKIIPLAKDRRTLCRLPLSSAPHKRQASFLCPLEALPVFLSSLSRGCLQVRPVSSGWPCSVPVCVGLAPLFFLGHVGEALGAAPITTWSELVLFLQCSTTSGTLGVPSQHLVREKGMSVCFPISLFPVGAQ